MLPWQTAFPKPLIHPAVILEDLGFSFHGFLFTFKSYCLNALPGSLPSIASLVLYLMEVTIFETAALLSLPSVPPQLISVPF